MREKTVNRKSPWRCVFLALAILAGLWLAVYRLALGYARHIVDKYATYSADVGIIGGADGPTAIFVTVGSGFDWDLLIAVAVLMVGIVGFLRLRRCGPKA